MEPKLVKTFKFDLDGWPAAGTFIAIVLFAVVSMIHTAADIWRWVLGAA